MSPRQICPIWGTPAEVNGENGKENIVYHVISPRAGGRYKIFGVSTRGPKSIEATLGIETKVKLTNWIVEQNRYGTVPTITETTIEKVITWPSLSVVKRADQLLLYLDSKAQRLGQSVHFILSDINDSYQQKTDDEIPAWTGSEILYEVTVLIDYCVDRGWIKAEIEERPVQAGLIDNSYDIALTVSGYTRLAELAGTKSGSQAFVAMWFDPNGGMDDAREAIREAIKDNGYEVKIIDEKPHINKICEEIMAEIRRSRFLIADFTAGEIEHGKDTKIHVPRGGVYYEAGFAQGLNIPVIWTCREDQIGQVHFDTNHYNHILWKDPEDLKKKLTDVIGAVIGDGPNKNKVGS